MKNLNECPFPELLDDPVETPSRMPGEEAFPDVLWACTGTLFTERLEVPIPKRFYYCYRTPGDAIRGAVRARSDWVWNRRRPTPQAKTEAMAQAARDGLAGVRLLDGDGNVLAVWRVTS